MRGVAKLAGMMLIPWLVGAPALARAGATHESAGARIASKGNGRGSPACATCHGAEGRGNPIGGPRLAGLPAGYATRQLENFASGTRANAIMSPIANTLSPDERQSVAAYFAKATLPGKSTPAASTAAAAAPDTAGEELAVRGRWSEELPGCVQCHGSGGQGVGDAFPPLTGQPAPYVENQLRAWQSGTRDPGPLGLMGGIANKLSAADVQAVAAYFSALPAHLEGHSP